MIDPGFDDVSGFSYAGLAIFPHTTGKWGAIDASGDTVIDRSMTRLHRRAAKSEHGRSREKRVS